MTEEHAAQPSVNVEKKGVKITSFIVPVIILVMLVAGVGYFAATHGGLDKAAVEKALKAWALNLEKSSAAEGSAPVLFTFESVEMEGGPADRHAIVIKPSFTTKVVGDESEGEVDLALSSESAVLYPDSIAFDALRVVLPKPLVLSSAGKEITRFTSLKPLEVNAERIKEDKRGFVHAKVNIPEKMIIESAEESRTWHLSVDAGASLETRIADDGSNLGSSKLDLSNILVREAENEIFKLGKLALSVADELAEADKHNVKLLADIQDAQMIATPWPWGALSLSADMNYKGGLPKDEEVTSWPQAEMVFNLAQLQLKNADAYISLKGNVNTTATELMPLGSLQVKVGNFAYIRSMLESQQLVKPEDKKLLNALFTQVTGQPYDEAVELDFALSRTQGGSLQIGHISFEEALVIALSGGKMQPRAPETAPASPQPAPIPAPELNIQ